ncbi:hypothetical protein MBLNU459_g4824t1 [Dothideomycetes sp. NU459]
MSKALNSPTARLLRSSRLFSLPPPLPTPALENASSGGFLRSSDTATLPYPTHQAISTPSSSKHRGDWGLKRPLPSRQIAASAPHLRVRQLDNLNHITDFASAADHTQTLAKWQELGVPMSHHQGQNSVSGNARLQRNISAFEEELDHTSLGHGMRDGDMSPARAMQLRSTSDLPAGRTRRWKTEGPWVSGLTEGDFERFLQTTVRRHRDGFVRFLEQVRAEQKRQQTLRAMRDEGLLSDRDARATELDLARHSRLDEHELDDFIKELRDNRGADLNLSSDLSGLVRDYFDLPAFPTPRGADAGAGPESATTRFLHEAASFALHTAPDGPPATHPSAGLSYLRTAAYMENHPVHGPQAKHAPVRARVLQTRGAARDQGARFGVAGFVVADPNKATHRPPKRSDNPTAEELYNQASSVFDLETPGGNKVWVHPTRANVDDKGHIRLSVERGDEQAIGVRTGNPVEAPTPQTSYPGRMAPLDSAPGQVRANFGTGLPNFRLARARGFEADEVDSAAQSKSSAQDPAAQIDALIRQHQKNTRRES